MFCKAITTNFCPCTSFAKSGSNYCKAHDYKNKEECHICMENVSCFAVLPCKHSLCMICVHKTCNTKGKFLCPFCRSSNSIEDLGFRYNNKKFITKQDTIIHIHTKIISLIKNSINNNGHHDVKSITKVMNHIFRNHLILFVYNKRFLVDVLKHKLLELSPYMYVKHYLKQLESYEQRMS